MEEKVSTSAVRTPRAAACSRHAAGSGRLSATTMSAARKLLLSCRSAAFRVAAKPLIPDTMVTASSTAPNSTATSPPRQSRASMRSSRPMSGGFLPQLTVVHDQLPAAARGQTRIVGDQHQGGAGLPVEFEQEVRDQRAGARIQVAGSSANSTRGSPAKARAMATRCCSPPDSCRG